MYRITREVSFSYGHRLYPYEGKCARLHGHNGRLRITLASESLDGAGMVIDFARVKAAIAGWLDRSLDHRLILHKDDPIVPMLRGIGEEVQAVDFHPTAENIARYASEHLRSLGLPVVEVQMQETENCSATYVVEGGGPAAKEAPPAG
jgi:6-pyruvoyltetrahydropterin/6-carboxytetrahydropterin synthase